MRRRSEQDPGAGSGKERDYSVRAVERVCLILNLLQESLDGITLNEVSTTTGLPKSSAFRYLWTLENHRYVERDEDGGLFRLGLGFVGMQSRQLEILRERARPSLEKLRDEFGETANLGLLDTDHVIYLDIVESRRGVRLAAARGDHEPIHSTALGKAIAAQLPEQHVQDLLKQHGLPGRTGNTITDIGSYFDELSTVREQGFAVDDCENEDDGRCVAVPLPGTRLPVAIGISAPASRFSVADAKTAGRALTEVASEIVAAAGR